MQTVQAVNCRGKACIPHPKTCQPKSQFLGLMDGAWSIHILIWILSLIFGLRLCWILCYHVWEASSVNTTSLASRKQGLVFGLHVPHRIHPASCFPLRDSSEVVQLFCSVLRRQWRHQHFTSVPPTLHSASTNLCAAGSNSTSRAP